MVGGGGAPAGVRAKKVGIPLDVIQAVKAWAAAPNPTDALADQRRRLDPLLVPVLVDEVAEITADQLIIALDMPSKVAGDDGPEVDFLGLPLSQTQARRVAVWLDEQGPQAEALGLAAEAWSKRLAAGFAVALAALKGGDTARAVAERLGVDPLQAASAGFKGAVDPRTSEQAGLRGMLAARAFQKKP